MSGLDAYKCTPRQVKKHVIQCMRAGLVPFIQSSPAMGKSAIVAEIANEFGLELIDHRLSTSAPEDLSGLPHFENGKASFLPFDTFPTEDLELPAGKQGWLLFLDEMNSATKMVQAAAYKLVLDKMVGQKRLHPNVVIVCAGNLSTDRAITNPIGTAMQSRLVHLIMDLDFKEFLEDVMLKQHWDSRIIAYLSYKPGQLHDFRPDHNEHTFCAPRTWEFMNKLIKGNPIRDEDAALYAGTITSGVAVDFIQFNKVYEALPKLKDIVDDPEHATMPVDSATRYATITHLLEFIEEKNFDAISLYVDRLSAEFRVLFYRGLRIQKPELKNHPAFRRALVTLSKYLNDNDYSAAA